MPQSPALNSDGPVRVTVSCDGASQAVLPLISLTVRHALNSVSWARLVIQDGDMPQGIAPLSEGNLFKPGALISISAGYGDEEQPIFSGLLVRHGFRIFGENDSRLELECRHAACKMTLGRRSAHYVDQTDSAIIQSLISAHGLGAEVDATSAQHKMLAQHYCSDWDFMLARAELMGLVLQCEDGKLVVKAPALSAAPTLQVTWGADLIDFSADIDARSQWTAVQASSWSLESQALLQGSSESPGADAGQGNLDGSTLAGVASPATVALQSCAPQTKDVLDAWAKSTQLKAALARHRGQLSFQGSALAKPGTVLELKGVSARFNGNCYLSAVQHEISDGNWISHAEFGMPPDWQMQRPDIKAPANAGLLPGVRGLHIGKVVKLDADPEGQQRIQISLPALMADTPTIWARLAQFHASNGFGSFFLPEVDDEVIVGFFNDDPTHPVVLGSLYSSSRMPPYELAAENNTKAVVTRYKHRLIFDEEKKSITIETASKNTLILDDEGKQCVLKDQNGNSITLDQNGITLDSIKDIKMTAQANIQGDATAKISWSATGDYSAKGLNVSAEAQIGFTAKGAASAELSASGQTTVKGALVMIN